MNYYIEDSFLDNLGPFEPEEYGQVIARVDAKKLRDLCNQTKRLRIALTEALNYNLQQTQSEKVPSND